MQVLLYVDAPHIFVLEIGYGELQPQVNSVVFQVLVFWPPSHNHFEL